MKQIHCKYCNALIDKDCININFRFLYCRVCNNYDRFDTIDMKPVDHRPPRKPKTKIKETSTNSSLSLTERYMPAGIIMLIWSSVCLGGLISISENIKPNDELFLYILGVGLLFGGIPLYIALRCLFTRVHIEITSNYIGISKSIFSMVFWSQRYAMHSFLGVDELTYRSTKTLVLTKIRLKFKSDKYFEFGETLSGHERHWLVTEIDRLIERPKRNIS